MPAYTSGDLLWHDAETLERREGPFFANLLDDIAVKSLNSVVPVKGSELADVVVINEAANASAEHLGLVRSVVRGLGADARIVETSRGQVALSDVLGTGLFSEEWAQ